MINYEKHKIKNLCDNINDTTKQNWERFPKEMLRARCLSSAVRALFPEVLSGFYTDIEMAEELTTEEDYNVVLNEDGEIQINEK